MYGLLWNGTGKPYGSDDDIERADCHRRESPCWIIGKHTHGDRVGTFCGEPDRLVQATR